MFWEKSTSVLFISSLRLGYVMVFSVALENSIHKVSVGLNVSPRECSHVIS